MNKYQEALEVIENVAYKQYEDVCYNKTSKDKAMLYEQQLKDVVKILKPIINKETPMKARAYSVGYYCGNCAYRLGDNNGWTQATVKYCGNCGQRIDWGKHE